MATTTSYEPLLRSPVKKTTSNPICKFLFYSLSLVAVISLTSFITLQFSSTTTTVDDLSSSSLCSTSPNPTSCHAIVSHALTTSNSHTPPSTAVHVLHCIITRSAHHLNAALRTAGDVHRRTLDPRQKTAVADCTHLMDLSRDRLLSSASAVAAGSHDDARAWLSAVLTNYDTCLDGLREGNVDEPQMEDHVKELVAMGSASLAVLNSAAPPPPAGGDELSKPVFGFPSWVSFKDRKLLEATSVDAVQANVVVAQDGSGKFRSVQAAVDAAPSNSGSRYVIYVKRGTYKENVQVGKQKKNIMIVGDGMDATTITGSLNVIDGSTTFNSATLVGEGDGFMLQDIGIQNTAGPQKHQAVALRTSADKSIINRCRLDAYQDTLYTHTLRQFFRDSTVSGTVDFIFGNSAVVLQNCKLVARKPMSKQQNLVTAQGRTDPNQNTGTSIQNCQVIPSSDLAPVKGSIPTYLGRPWKEYSRTVFMQSFIDNHVVPKGWLEWDGNFALKTLFYGEYQNKGPGAGTAGRVKWSGYHASISTNDAWAFTVGRLIQGGVWLKGTGVAFTEGL